jgi:mono/diheme cytochrome c family protein
MAWATLGACLLSVCNRQPEEAKPKADGALIFSTTCARCHGVDGCGGDMIGLPVRKRICNAQASLSDQQLKQFIKQGQGAMPAFGEELNDEQVEAVVRHLRSLNPPRSN